MCVCEILPKGIKVIPPNAQSGHLIKYYCHPKYSINIPLHALDGFLVNFTQPQVTYITREIPHQLVLCFMLQKTQHKKIEQFE